MGRRIGTLGLVNYRQHPTNKQYRVYSFDVATHAELFEQGLTAKNIWFERDTEDYKDTTLHLFAVREKDFELVQQVNFDVSAKTRKHIIPNLVLRYLLLAFVLGAIGFALFGYLKS